MISYVLKHCLQRYHLAIHAEASSLVASVTLDECRCHELARAVLEMLESRIHPERLSVVDGRVGGVDHSWLMFSETRVVLDVYRPGFYPQVVLVDRLVAGDYVPGPTRRDVREPTVVYLRRQMGQWR